MQMTSTAAQRAHDWSSDHERPEAVSRTWIVVPCFNEALRLDSGAFATALDQLPNLALVLVNDGSTDRTAEVLASIAARFPARVEVIEQSPNKGKAEAVRIGMLHAMTKGSAYAGYFDADLATPLDEVSAFIATLDDNPQVDVVLGARVALLGRQIERKPWRHYLGRIFATAASVALALPVCDTQCGAKLFRVNERTRALFATRFGSRWVFDVELLARYLGAGNHSRGLFELPLRRWTDVGESHVRAADFLRAFAETAKIHRTYRRAQRSRGIRLLATPFLRYMGAGGVGTAVHYLALLFAVETGVASPATGSVVGAGAGALTNYLLNYHLTFASTSSHWRTMPRFFVVAALSMLLTGAGMSFATVRLHVHYLLAQFGCTLAVLILGYAINKIWTFAAAPSRAPSESAQKPAQKAIEPSQLGNPH